MTLNVSHTPNPFMADSNKHTFDLQIAKFVEPDIVCFLRLTLSPLQLRIFFMI